jgi:hypothetical protein
LFCFAFFCLIYAAKGFSGTIHTKFKNSLYTTSRTSKNKVPSQKAKGSSAAAGRIVSLSLPSCCGSGIRGRYETPTFYLFFFFFFFFYYFS